MVCQNQSIDDSDAPLARDLRLLVRERIAAGDSDTQVIDFLVARYGEFVLLKPRLNAHTCCCGCCRRWRWSEAVSRCGRTAGGARIPRWRTISALLKLTPDEEARLERLIEAERSADKPA